MLFRRGRRRRREEKGEGLIERGGVGEADEFGADECLADITSDVVAAEGLAKPHWMVKEIATNREHSS